MPEGTVARTEEELARAAARGDGQAFAALYEQYEKRAFNLALRVTGSHDDAADATQDAFLNVMKRLPKLEGRDLAFGSYLFTATRNACYDLIEKRNRAEPSDEIPEGAAPVGPGGGFDPGDPDDDPGRKVLLEAQQEEIREANARIPERQREVLALRELEDLSYDEIADVMDMNRNSVAQLISRARISLRDELRQTALAAVAITSPECERALPLIAAQQDGQLDPGSEDSDWLLDHVAECDTCAVGREAMAEAGVSYRAWAPVAAAPWLFEETMAKAAELTGADWSELIAERAALRERSGSQGGGANGASGDDAGHSGDAGAKPKPRWHKRRDVLLAACLTAVLLVVAFETGVRDDDPPQAPAEPAAVEEPLAPAAQEEPKAKKKTTKKQGGGAPASDGDEPTSSDGEVPVTPVTPSDDAGQAPDSARKAPRSQGRIRGGGGGVPSNPEPPKGDTPPVTEEPPVVTEPPPPPPPAECRDRRGNPIPCPPGSGVPGGPN